MSATGRVMTKLGDEIKKIHKLLDEMTPAENLVVAEQIIDELHAINDGLRADNAKLRALVTELKNAYGATDKKRAGAMANNARLREALMRARGIHGWYPPCSGYDCETCAKIYNIVNDALKEPTDHGAQDAAT